MPNFDCFEDSNRSDPDITLPNETLTAIFQDLPQSTLSQISRVSHRFRLVAERQLYSAVSVLDILSDTSPIPCKTLQLCESIFRRMHLVDSVKRFHVRWQTDASYRPSSTHLLGPAGAELTKVLQLLHLLESLELLLGPVNLSISDLPPLHTIERILHGCQLPYLHFCSLGADGRYPYSNVIDSFLISVPSLRHLKFSDHFTTLNLPPEALPNLISFRGSPNTASSLLPGRPVQSLSLIGQDSDVTRYNLPQMTHTSLPLRILDLSAMSVRPTLLRNVSKYLPTIEVLRVKLALRHTLHFALSGIRILEGLTPVLSAFDQLMSLDLSPTSVDGVGGGNAEEEYSLCNSWSAACPTLKQIIFPSNTEWFLDVDGIWKSSEV